MIPDIDASEMKGVGFRCVNCGRRIGKLFMQYSPGNIRLMKCDNCKAVADPYIECEFMIIFINLILHKPKAFRHMLYNVLNLEKIDIKGIALKSGLMYFILDAYRVSLLIRSKGTGDSLRNSLEFTWTCLKVQRNLVGGPCFKLLQDVPLSHDGLGFSFCFYLHCRYLCSIVKHGGLKSLNAIEDLCMHCALLKCPWCQILSFTLAAQSSIVLLGL